MATINIPDDLKESLAQIVQDSDEFNSVDEYVTYVLQQVVDKKKKAAEHLKQKESAKSYH